MRRAGRRRRPSATFDLAQAAFLDTETTGLAGGTGTAAFLIGLGFVEDDRFRVRQYFMRDYHEEAALLRGLAEDLVALPPRRHVQRPHLRPARCSSRATGSTASAIPLADVPHLDLLPPARRLWKLRLVSCRLQALEADLLDLRRRADVPGEEIPRIYFDYVRRRDGRALLRVLEHNRVDVVSLAALAVLACQWVEEGRAEDPRDVYSLAQVLEQARLFERCEGEYRRVLATRRRRACASRRCCGWPAASAGGRPRRRGRAVERRPRRRATGAAAARLRSTTSTAAATSQRRWPSWSRGWPSWAARPAAKCPYGLARVAADLRRRRHRLLAKRARAGRPRTRSGTSSHDAAA